MESPKACIRKPNKGFTLIELCVVMGLLAIVGSLGLFMSMDSMRGGAFRDDRDTVISGLQRARSLAIDNMCIGAGCTEGKPHGVHFDPAKKELVFFQGDNFDQYDASNETVEFGNQTTYIDGASAVDIVFDRLSGNATPQTIILKDNAGHTSAIAVNSEGRIDWTN